MKRIAASVAMALGLMGGAQAATFTYDFTIKSPFRVLHFAFESAH